MSMWSRPWAVRVNEIKLHGRPDDSGEIWRRSASHFARHDRLREVYTTRFGRIMDVTCQNVYEADQLLLDLAASGIPADCMRVVGGKASVIK